MVIIYRWSSALEETSAKTFSVIHNTFDPAEFGTKGGAALNSSETSEENVDAFTICIRFQGRRDQRTKLSATDESSGLPWFILENYTKIMAPQTSLVPCPVCKLGRQWRRVSCARGAHQHWRRQGAPLPRPRCWDPIQSKHIEITVSAWKIA